MTTNVSAYCAIGPYEINSIVRTGGVGGSGGSVKVDEVPVVGRSWADVRNKGRAVKKYSIEAISLDRDAIETFLEIVNTAEEDDPFYPWDAERFGEIAVASATVRGVELAAGGVNFYQAVAEITCREPWLYGENQGLDELPSAVLPYVSGSIAANLSRTPIRLLMASGDYMDDGWGVDVCRGIGGAVCYIVDNNYCTWYYTSRGIRFGKVQMARISCGSAAYGIGMDGNIYVWNGIDWLLFCSGSGATDISCASDGSLFIVSGGALKKWNGSGWDNLGGASITRISAVSSVVVYTCAPDSVWQCVSGSWTRLASGISPSDISAIGTDLFVAILSGELYYWNSGFYSHGGANLVNVSINSWWPDWDVIVTTTNGAVWRYTTAGGWVGLDYPTPAYVDDLSARITPGSSTIEHDRELLLCEHMLRDDLFKLDWRGEIEHSWEADFTKPWAAIDVDLRSKTSGGSITDEVLTLDNDDYLMIPFYGPLPISGEAKAVYLELYVTALTGNGATCQVALETDLSDMAEVDHDELVVGRNIIYFPDLEGESHVAIGIKAAASGSVSLSKVKGMVKRYVAPSKIPYADPLEEVKIRVESSAGTQLAFLRVDYNDRYYY